MLQFQAENFAPLWTEAQALLRAHCQEVVPGMVAPASVLPALYQVMEEAKALHITTARLGGELVGYALYLLSPDMHSQGQLTAHSDAFFLAPQQRRGWAGRDLLRAAEEQLRARGVTRLVQTVTPRRKVGPLLHRMGYELVSHQYFKEL